MVDISIVIIATAGFTVSHTNRSIGVMMVGEINEYSCLWVEKSKMVILGQVSHIIPLSIDMVIYIPVLNIPVNADLF